MTKTNLDDEIISLARRLCVLYSRIYSRTSGKRIDTQINLATDLLHF